MRQLQTSRRRIIEPCPGVRPARPGAKRRDREPQRRLRRAHHYIPDAGLIGGHATGRVRVRPLCPPYGDEQKETTSAREAVSRYTLTRPAISGR
jgi:hypothetical protein